MSAAAPAGPGHPTIVLFAEDYTSPTFKVAGYEDKTVVVMGHLTLPKDTTFKVAVLVNFGKITTSGAHAKIESTGKVYNFGKIEGDTVSIKCFDIVPKLTQPAAEELQKLGIPVTLSGNDKVIIASKFLEYYA